MSAQTFEFGEQNEDQGNQGSDSLVTLKRSEIRTLEQQARRAKDFETRATTAERRLAFVEAGVPTDKPIAQYFIRGYDGEVTAEAIKKAAIEAGIISETKAPDAEQSQQAQTPPEQQGTVQDQRSPEDIEAEKVQREALAAMQAATMGGVAPGEASMQSQMEEALRKGGPEGLAQWMQSKGLPVHEQ